MTNAHPTPQAQTVTAALAAVLLALPAVSPAHAQTVAYDISFPNAAHHEAQVTLTLAGLDRGPVALRMSRSSPGRYALHEFAKNVYAVEVRDGHGRVLTPTRPDPYQWDVSGHDGTVKVSYTLFADRGDGTYAQIDRTHAHLNMPAVFMWARGMDTRPIRITFHPPEGSGWNIATQLFPTADSTTFTAPGLQYFMDSPTELSDFMLREWTVTSNGRTWPIRMAIHHTGTAQEADDYAEMAKKVVAQEIAVYGETPQYDVGYYTFIADYLPWASGDGMEHRNSTILTSTASLAQAAHGLIGTVSHEFFHSWNVERIRPRGLEPFDFTRANMSDALWFAEGFTSYYGPLLLKRAGITTMDEFARNLGFPISFVLNSPARQFFSPAEMSMQAPFVDAATSIDPTNRNNTFISYYTWGSVVGAGLDLTLRQRYGRTLDDLMRRMWQKYGRTEVSYTLDDIERTLGEVTADPAFARDFFTRYVRGHDVPDFQPLLAQAGLLLRPANPGKAFLGLIQLDYDQRGATILGTTQIGSPLYRAGLDRGDLITTLDGRPLTSDSAWGAVKDAHVPGDVLEVQYESRGETRTARLTVDPDPRLELVTYEAAGLPLTDSITRFREAWLGPR
ncbi:MAG: M61 family metallopeptidase [Gemmatimonadales bacterium]